MASQKELDKFLEDPDRYANSRHTLPAVLPKRLFISSVKAIFPRSFELQGYCPVTFAEGSSEYVIQKKLYQYKYMNFLIFKKIIY